MAPALAAHLSCRAPTQLVVDERHHLLARSEVALVPRLKERRHAGGRRLSHECGGNLAPGNGPGQLGVGRSEVSALPHSRIEELGFPCYVLSIRHFTARAATL